MIGPYVNAAAVVIGGLGGAFIGNSLPERIRAGLPQTFGLASMGLGIMLIVKVKYMPAVVLAMVLGAMLGELFYVEKAIGRVAAATRGFVDKFLPAKEGLSHEEFMDKFVAIVVLFAASGTGIFGAMHEGMTGDPSILYIKTILDLFTSAIFATALGYAVATIFVPLLFVQVCLFFLAGAIMPMTTPNMMADFSCAGGLIMLATGLRICGIKMFPVANMLPALILVMPFSYLWVTYVH
jgi:uncharacterized membrane protein YqgA involved in biofilm formation